MTQVTLAYARIGINRADGVVYFLHRRSPEDAAFENWGYKASPDELPALRASSDISWGSKCTKVHLVRGSIASNNNGSVEPRGC